MRIASIPFNEELRLQDLFSYNILDSDKEQDFDDLLEIAAQIYGCPIAAITFVDSDRQWLKSKIGLADDIHETSRDHSFCAHTILDNEVLIVEDATKDERFYGNPLVTDGMAIRFYAGAPIVSATGFRLGSICVIDDQPRELSQQEAKVLRILSRQISKLLELRLKNKLLREKAEEQLRLEKILLLKTLQEHEKEKQSISAELHENIAQTLAATKFYLEVAEESNSAEHTNLISKCRENVASLVKQVRELSQSIAPSLLEDVELEGLLRGMLSQFHNRSALEVNLLYEGDSSVAAATALTVYRIVEIQLENVRQHAKAAKVTVNVNAFAAIYLSIKDNGVGFDGKAFKMGGGLNKILSRVEALKGRVEITSGVKGGCELNVLIP